MKIGILTYHNTRNVGAALQAYALQRFISKMGFNCEIIDYRCAHLERTYKIKKITEIKSLKEFIKWSLSVGSSKQAKIKFDNFFEKNQQVSGSFYSKDNIDATNSIYDVFIVGSDQVWNMNLNGNDSSFLLDFVSQSKKRISYAASFGYKKVPKEYIKDTKRYLSLFNAISVRETAGHKIVKELIDGEPRVVLDPTLLLKKDEWEELNPKPIREGEYILVYTIAATPTILDFAINLGKKHNCEVIYIHHSYKLKSGVTNVRDCSPIEFLSYVKYAKFIISSSFHGVCISLLYQKDFFFELDVKPQNNNSRIETLIGTLDLWDRQIIGGECKSNNINYELVNKKLSSEREVSRNFLIESIN